MMVLSLPLLRSKKTVLPSGVKARVSSLSEWMMPPRVTALGCPRGGSAAKALAMNRNEHARVPIVFMLQISSFLRAEIVSSIAASAPRLCDERYLHEDDRTPVGDEELPVLQGVRGRSEERRVGK